MDYSTSSDFVLSDNGNVGDEPEIINETFESVEPEFTEMAHNADTDKVTPIDQASTPAGDDLSHHTKLNGIEVPGSAETEPLEIPVTRDWGRHGKGSGGGPEGWG
jgi:hypothetical protein